MVQIAEDRPPYVQFELRAVEDRSALIETGHYGSKDVAFALITPAGSKDRVERNAEEWLEHIRTQVEEERFPARLVPGISGFFRGLEKGERTCPGRYRRPQLACRKSCPGKSHAQLEHPNG